MLRPMAHPKLARARSGLWCRYDPKEEEEELLDDDDIGLLVLFGEQFS